MIGCAGCSDSGSRTAKAPTPAESRPAQTAPATQAAPPDSQPARKPDELPPSTYSSKPPYALEIHVRSPREEQPGWVRIVQLADKNLPASVTGQFPEQNLMVVDTQNVQMLELHVGHLPMAEKKRIRLRIDGLGMELVRDKRPFVTLQRQKTGAWIVESRH
jgi:hypothetical protein